MYTVEANDGKIEIGTRCKNNGCSATYSGEISNDEVCRYHPGGPGFHDGAKFWSCCKKMTCEFDNFENQVGCMTGKHAWTLKVCRFLIFEDKHLLVCHVLQMEGEFVSVKMYLCVLSVMGGIF